MFVSRRDHHEEGEPPVRVAAPIENENERGGKTRRLRLETLGLKRSASKPRARARFHHTSSRLGRHGHVSRVTLRLFTTALPSLRR